MTVVLSDQEAQTIEVATGPGPRPGWLPVRSATGALGRDNIGDFA